MTSHGIPSLCHQPLISLQKVGQYSPHISLHHLPITAPIPGTLPAISSRPTSTLHIRPLSPFLPATASPPLAGSSSSTANRWSQRCVQRIEPRITHLWSSGITHDLHLTNRSHSPLAIPRPHTRPPWPPITTPPLALVCCFRREVRVTYL